MKKAAPAKKGGAKKTQARQEPWLVRAVLFIRRWFWRLILIPPILLLLVVVLFRFVNPPTTHTIWAEKRRLGEVDRQWVAIENMSPYAPRSIVAAEDANFCLHWGFDMVAIREALDDGAQRGASTITQQTVKNVFLWQERSWLRKALEAVITPVVEIAWPKKRILEVYLNVAEMDEGVFGIEAAAHRYFDTAPRDLTAIQAARIAAVLPDPKRRDAARPGDWLRRRASSIADGAATIEADGRADCFED
ncbi:monofunctional biosynthetic peptidoglycan transglycosylase [Tropicimonas isoalkanivorans]|uniref:Biosynthetic peptidoglycan transglycosylase n=1 Tax=Tropicimonas isoalkanivorans TaxID=441112 RepID=A0A1I1LWR0_9RHOB|nr:monofunctional biosynthetic peptidoglycan transglycosylase [Tropicimonas isoalkanivorans]SFC77346.1 monofunctional biosynthetic peptidoglycan transglycosylase [Tropicimonas isoalkanivorans]